MNSLSNSVGTATRARLARRDSAGSAARVLAGVLCAAVLAGCSGGSSSQGPRTTGVGALPPVQPSPSSVPASSAPTPPAPEPPLTLMSLRSARVPSLCDHPAGRLSKGVRKGNGRNGEVRLDEELTRFGAEVPGRPNGAAAVFHCSQGGIGWPDYVLFYDNTAKLVGTVDTGSVGTSPGWQAVSQVAFSGSTVEVTIGAVPLEDDNELWGTSAARATYAWSSTKGAMTRRSLLVSSPDAMARQLATALQRRDRVTVASLLHKAAVANAMPNGRTKVEFDHCVGVTIDYPWLAEQMRGGDRGCLINYRCGGEAVSTFMAVVKRTGFSWKVIKYVGVAG